MTFAEKVREEAREQQALRQIGQPIPPELKVYARRSGAVVLVVGLIGAGIITVIGMATETFYIGFILFFLAIGAAGLLQLITGTNWLSTPAKK